MNGRLLLALPQSLFDRSSGAAVSMRHLACQLAQQGWTVHLLCTSATESGRPGLPQADEDLAGATLELLRLPDGAGRDWALHDGGRYEQRVHEQLRQLKPDVLLSFGADALEHRLCRAAQALGTKVVLALHNLAYGRLTLPPCAAVLVPSEFMAKRYAGLPVPVKVLPPPLWDADVIAAQHEPVFASFVNPEPEKGADLVARLAARCPDWPFLVVEARAGAGRFLAAARHAQLDPAALSNVRVMPGGRPLREVLAVTRVVLMPSRVEEAAGRVAAEALANGIPALVSDRGGLPETVAGAGTVIPWGADEDEVCERWAAALQALADDANWAAAAARAAAVAPRWRSAAQGPVAAAWFGAFRGG
jgi:glycosyltransferase involved in cell wall biosynthesis